jgi:hypothetical protein
VARTRPHTPCTRPHTPCTRTAHTAPLSCLAYLLTVVDIMVNIMVDIMVDIILKW